MGLVGVQNHPLISKSLQDGLKMTQISLSTRCYYLKYFLYWQVFWGSYENL